MIDQITIKELVGNSVNECGGMAEMPLLNESTVSATIVENMMESQMTNVDEVEAVNQTEHIDFNMEATTYAHQSDELLKRILGDCLITTETTYESPKALLEYHGAPVIRSRNVTTIIGGPKVAKTFLTTIFEASFSKGEYIGFNAIEGTRLFHADTEQDPCDTQELLFRVEKMVEHEVGLNSMVMANLRKIPVNERIMLIEDSLKEANFQVVFIDGIKDFVNNINDPAECTHLINELLRLCDTYDVSFVVVIHKNKGDENARGHLGTELMNKSDVVINMEKADNTVKVSPLICRKKEFDTFYFTIKGDENDGIAIPVIGDATEMINTFTKNNNKANEERDKKIEYMISVLEPGKEYTKSEIYRLANIKETTGSRYIDIKLKDRTLRETVNKKIVLNQ